MCAWIKGGAILERMVARKTVCLRRLGGNRAGELQAGRFFANPKVTPAKIIEGWSMLTGPACVGRHMLAVEDRSEVKFPTTAQRRRGLGAVKKGNAYGVLVQAMIAVDAADGACLGLVGGEVWSRAGVNPVAHRQRPLEERESVHWLDAAQQAKRVLKDAALVTVVADRDADAYPMWARLPERGFHLLIRARKDRCLRNGGMMDAAADGFASGGKRTIELPAREPVQARRQGVLELRFGEIEICRPQDQRDPQLPRSLRLRMIEVKEHAPPAGGEPVHWRLLTTHWIADAAQAWVIVDWYRRRWIIEQNVAGDEVAGTATGG